LQRILTSATLVLLLVATAAAFAITERLKLTKSALMPGTKVSKVFSPVCGCSRSRANIRVVLRRPDTVTADIVDARGGEIRTLLTAQPWRRGELRLRWDGRTDAGARAPDGAYRVRIHLDRQHQTIVLPNVLRLDTKPPTIATVRLNRDTFSPDGDRQADFVRVQYRLSKPARLALFLGGRRILLTKLYPQAGSTSWKGTARSGVVRPGRYTLEVGALDLAGNATPQAERARVRVRLRYIALASQRIVVPAGKKFEIGVSTDAVRYRWRLGARKGRNGGAVLRLTAPTQKGTYTLTVSERGHVDRARVVVR
jgi:FlgD Ig-like domain